jgi:hypothetical protein
LAHLQATVLRFPTVVRSVADPFLAADVGEGLATLDTLQNPDDLLFTEATLAHVISSFLLAGLSHIRWTS